MFYILAGCVVGIYVYVYVRHVAWRARLTPQQVRRDDEEVMREMRLW